jgi:hypothetical protein
MNRNATIKNKSVNNRNTKEDIYYIDNEAQKTEKLAILYKKSAIIIHKYAKHKFYSINKDTLETQIRALELERNLTERIISFILQNKFTENEQLNLETEILIPLNIDEYLNIPIIRDIIELVMNIITSNSKIIEKQVYEGEEYKYLKYNLILTDKMILIAKYNTNTGNEVVAGYIKYDFQDTFIFIDAVEVHPDFRGLKLCNKLIKLIIDRFPEYNSFQLANAGGLIAYKCYTSTFEKEGFTPEYISGKKLIHQKVINNNTANSKTFKNNTTFFNKMKIRYNGKMAFTRNPVRVNNKTPTN